MSSWECMKQRGAGIRRSAVEGDGEAATRSAYIFLWEVMTVTRWVANLVGRVRVALALTRLSVKGPEAYGGFDVAMQREFSAGICSDARCSILPKLVKLWDCRRSAIYAAFSSPPDPHCFIGELIVR